MAFLLRGYKARLAYGGLVTIVVAAVRPTASTLTLINPNPNPNPNANTNLNPNPNLGPTPTPNPTPTPTPTRIQVAWAMRDAVTRRWLPPAYAAGLLTTCVGEAAKALVFVAQMAMFNRVADPRIGGTYMTMLNTLANLG